MFKRLLKLTGRDPRNGTQVEHVDNVQFLGEQDGVTERLLKERWIPILRQHGVRRAYLVIARLEGGVDSSVALALTKGISPDSDVVNDLVSPFRAIMAGSQFVDMLFLDGVSEAKCALVCKPFLCDV